MTMTMTWQTTLTMVKYVCDFVRLYALNYYTAVVAFCCVVLCNVTSVPISLLQYPLSALSTDSVATKCAYAILYVACCKTSLYSIRSPLKFLLLQRFYLSSPLFLSFLLIPLLSSPIIPKVDEDDEPLKGKQPTRSSRANSDGPTPRTEAPTRSGNSRNDVPRERDRDSRHQHHADEDQTPRVQKTSQNSVKQSPYFGLQDAPSPSGRLSDRIHRLKQR